MDKKSIKTLSYFFRPLSTKSCRIRSKYVIISALFSQMGGIVIKPRTLTEENAGLINRDTLSMMKDGVILLNTARGPLLDEKAVFDALSSGKLRGAAVDVVSKEPMERSNPLLTAPNCIITPHMAWAPTESRQRILNITANSIAAFLEGKPINTVNM